MINNDKYREIKITYIHIITLIIAFVAIGLLLFFLGYRIGKGSVENNIPSHDGQSIDKKIVRVNNKVNNNRANQTKIRKIKAKDNFTSEIDKELQMHNTIGMKDPVKKNTPPKETVKLIKSKRIKRSTFYAIQIGAFRDHKGAKKEAQRFSKKYSTEIVKSGNLYKVRIGSYKTEKRAKSEIKKNPKLKGSYTVKIKR